MKPDESLEMELALHARRTELTSLLQGCNREYAVRHLTLTHRLIKKRQQVGLEVKNARRFK